MTSHPDTAASKRAAADPAATDSASAAADSVAADTVAADSAPDGSAPDGSAADGTAADGSTPKRAGRPRLDKRADAHFDDARDAILAEAIPDAAFDGWGEAMLRRAARAGGISPGMTDLALPDGARDLVYWFVKRDNDAMTARLKRRKVRELRMRERITAAVRTRLEIAERHREASRRATLFLAFPQNAGVAARALGETVDAMWRAAGDTATDFNWYSKRATLAGVYSATLLYWLGDDSEGRVDSWAFLDRRINDAMTFEKVKAQMRSLGERLPLDRLPSPLTVAARLRYGLRQR